MRAALITAALSIVLAAPAAAQNETLKLSFHDGLVSLDAHAVPVRTILTEWGKVGGTKIVGADRLAGAPLTLKLVDVSEAKALETILRSAAGYLAAPRAALTSGSSMYDRILVMATSSAPPPATAARTAPAVNNAFNGTQRFIPPATRADPQEDQPEEPDDNPPNPPVFSFPPQAQPGVFNNAPPQLGAPQGGTANPSQPGTPTPGASAPGMIVAPPQPGTAIRPPGIR